MLRSSLALFVVAASGFGMAQNANLLLRPPLNTPIKYEIKMESAAMATPQGDFQLKIQILTGMTFTEVTPEKVTSTQKLESIKVLLNGNELPIPAAAGGLGEIQISQKPNGELITRSASAGMMDQSSRYNMMMAFVLPDKLVALGESWTRDHAGDKAKGTVPARSKMTFEKQEMVGGVMANRVAVAYSELEGDQPMGMVGKAWIEASTGVLLKMEASLTHVSMNEMMPPMNMAFTMTRVS
jgi:hypothetical protein